MSRGEVFLNPLPDVDSQCSSFSEQSSSSFSSLPPQPISLDVQRTVEDLLLPRSCIVLERIVGKGYFGHVYKGIMHNPNTGRKDAVAVKTLKERSQTNRAIFEGGRSNEEITTPQYIAFDWYMHEFGRFALGHTTVYGTW
uniref:Protein kinase domain-containing protein n=1 Tax=Steinernema glaseri TaxID=37863 RepID=A0A1I7YZG2_9BILA